MVESYEIRTSTKNKQLNYIMPVIPSNYQSPSFLIGGNMQTIYPFLFRKVNGVNYTRERIPTHDHDFIDLDWSQKEHNKLIIVSHGLEGSSDSTYVKGIVKAANLVGFDALAWNYRGCSGEVNNLTIAYHSGATDDLEWVIQHVLQKYDYEAIYLVGYSLGGNLTLKYVGEGRQLSPLIKKVAVMSVPCNLASCAENFKTGFTRIYQHRFLKTLKAKAHIKSERSPHIFDPAIIEKISTIEEFDDLITGPHHGFKNAADYYAQCRSDQFIPSITLPTLLINAKNDPFLTRFCFPYTEASQSKYVYLEAPDEGGHVGFYAPGGNMYWSDRRILQFLLHQ